jgi:phage terminase small subunit
LKARAENLHDHHHYEAAMPVLKNPKHEAFAQARAKGRSIDAAYAEAGFKPHRGNAARLSAIESVSARVAELTERTAQRAEIDIERVLRELVSLGTSDFRRALDEDGNLKPVHEWPDDLAASVASVEIVTKSLPGEADDEQEPQGHGGSLTRNRNAKVEYVHKVRFWDKNSALEKIAKHLGMFIEKHEVTVTHRFEDMADDEIDREIIALAGETRRIPQRPN